MMAQPLVIAGASHAGLQVATSAREAGFEGDIIMVGDEPHLPYQRPPLSKGFLTGKTAAAQLPLRPQAFYDERRITLRLGERVMALDLQHQRLVMASGAPLNYGQLAITTGARARRLTVPGAAALQGVLPLRSLGDAQRLAQAMPTARRACVIGGGFIGLEVASALMGRGVAVTVLESQPRLLPRAFAPEMSRYVAQLHEAHSVVVCCGSAVRALEGHGGQVAAVVLDDGRRVACDLVVVGIGVLPNTEWAVRAGLKADAAGGLLVDALGRTSHPGVFAAGDCAAMASPYAAQPGQPVRLESIQAANDGARAIASVLVGQPEPCDAVPWFWSEQHGVKLQMAGLGQEGDALVWRGQVAEHRFSVFHVREGRVVAVHSVNRPAEHLLGRRLVAARVALDARDLADEAFDLKRALQQLAQP